MTKWVIRAVSEDGKTQVSEIEHETDIASLSLDLFETMHGWGCWTNIDIDRVDE